MGKKRIVEAGIEWVRIRYCRRKSDSWNLYYRRKPIGHLSDLRWLSPNLLDIGWRRLSRNHLSGMNIDTSKLAPFDQYWKLTLSRKACRSSTVPGGWDHGWRWYVAWALPRTTTWLQILELVRASVSSMSKLKLQKRNSIKAHGRCLLEVSV